MALSDYEAPEGSQQISVKEGDIVIVLSEEQNGFYMAEVEGNKGLVPVGYVGEYNPKHPVSTYFSYGALSYYYKTFGITGYHIVLIMNVPMSNF